jgi:hypothetical protein
MKLKYLNLGAIETGLWGIAMGLFIGIFLAKHCPISDDSNYCLMFWGFGFLFASFVVGAIRARNLRKG